MVLDITPKEFNSQAQYDFYLDDTSRFPAFVGGYGSGKTWAGVHKLLRKGALNRGATGLVIEPTAGMIKKVLWPLLIDKILDPLGIAYTLNKSDMHMFLPWGDLWFLSGDAYDRIAGINSLFGHMDEAHLCHPMAWKNLTRRGREISDTWQSAVVQNWATFTPDMPGWTIDFWGRQEIQGEPNPEGYDVYHGSTRDNWHVAQTYVGDLEGSITEGEIIAVVDGHFLQSTHGLVYSSFNRRHNVKDVKYIYGKPLHVSFDFNGPPVGMHAGCMQQPEPGGMVQVISEFHRANSVLEDCIESVLKRYSTRHLGDVIIHGDATGGNSASETSYFDQIMKCFREGITRKGVHTRGFKGHVSKRVRRSNPGVENTVQITRAAFRNGRGEVNLVISPDCKVLIKDMISVQYARHVATAKGKSYRGGEHDIYKDISELTHASDWLRYAMFNLRPGRREFKSEPGWGISVA